MKRIQFFVPILFLLISACATRLADAPIVVPLNNAPSPELVGKAVKLALAGREWRIEKEAPGYLEATLAHANYTVRLGITYDRAAATIVCLEAKHWVTETEYERPKSSRVEDWIQNLTNDIPRHLTRLEILAQ